MQIEITFELSEKEVSICMDELNLRPWERLRVWEALKEKGNVDALFSFAKVILQNRAKSAIKESILQIAAKDK